MSDFGGFSPADLRELHELRAADWICDLFARAARMGLEGTLSTRYPTPFHCWVAELGIREGQAVRGAAAGAAA